MSSTSLAEQLQKLAVPQTSIYKEDKKRASLLFDPKEAASKDRDIFYEIGLSGLKELIALYEGFRVYEDALFSVSSKDFERAVQTKEVNQNLDQTIEKFLLQLSPYFLLQPSHKALEWLVNRYHIHQYNQDAIMALILPYHETKIFIRFVQLLRLKGSKWDWLEPVQKHNIPLTKQVLHNQCVSNSATLQFIAKNTSKYVTEYGERATQLTTVFAFFSSTAIGTINTTQSVNESIISTLLPIITIGLESPIIDFRSSAYIILGYLSTKTTFKKKTINELIVRLLTAECELSKDVVLLINVIYTNQKHLEKMSENVLSNISIDVMHSICKHLKKLVELKINIHVFSLVFLSCVVTILQRNIEDFRRFRQLPQIFIDEVDLKNQQPEKIIKQILNVLISSKIDQRNAEESDIEIIDDDNDGDEFSSKIVEWYSEFLKNIEKKYPAAFDKVIKREMSSESKLSSKKQQQLSKVLGFKPAVAHKVGGQYLFENLNHVNPQLRIEAVNYVAKEFQILKIEDEYFLRDSIINRFKDDNPDVVTAALQIPCENLQKVLNASDLTDLLVHITAKHSKKWLHVIMKAISKFCMLDNLPVNQKVLFSVMPYIFAKDKESAKFTFQLLSSLWAKNLGLTNKSVGAINYDNHIVLNEQIFKALFIDRIVILDHVINHTMLNKDNTLDMCLYVLFKSSSLNKLTTQDAVEVLNIILESVESKSVVTCDDITFSSKSMVEFIKLARKNKILFEVMEYVFSRIVDQVSVHAVTKPWCNILNTPETILIRRLYEIFITGCGIPHYNVRYAKLLQKLLLKLFNDPKDKFDFLANFACGHILYAVDPKDVISPELQLRSLKLMSNFINISKNAEWIYSSDVLILTILFDLNNPVAPIRQCVIELIETILNSNPDKKLIYVQLLQQLMNHKEELILDHEQLPQVLKTVLSNQSIGNKVFRKNCLLKLTGILIGETPSHIKSALVRVLSGIANASTICYIVPALNSLEKVMTQNKLDMKFTFDIYESSVFRIIYSKINETTVSSFHKEEVWKSIEIGLKECRECVLNENQSYDSPCVLILRQINEDVFKKVPQEKSENLIHLITLAGAFSNNPTIASAASKVVKKIHLHFKNFKSILDEMLSATDPAANIPKKKKATMSMISYQLVETDAWRLGVTFLEYIQSKKKMTVDTAFVTILFQLLNKCLRFEEQSYVEYTKQLLLSCLWYFCKKFVNDTDKEQLKSIKNIFDVETIVQCIRGTQNPQTQHHALILLSHAAYMLPEQVLHHTMEIFTFMGSSVLRHDDAYSFQIITKIIETLIPILVKLDKNIEEYSEKELQQLEKRVVPILRIFADVVLHVPEHRRLPLYQKLIETIGPNQFLWIFLALLLETHIAHFNDNKKKDKRPSRALADQESPINRMDFGQSILLEFPPEICLENFIKLTAYMKSLPLQKDEEYMDTNVDPGEIFSLSGHTPIQLRHYKYVLVTFMTSCLSSSRFIHHCNQAVDLKAMENNYKTFIINILTFIQSISKVADEKTAKYWRVMLHHSYDLLDHTNNLLSAPMFLSVIRGLLKHTLQTVRRKAMELLNTKIQFSPEMFVDVDKNFLFSLLPVLLDIVKTIEIQDVNLDENAALELELNQQTALLSLKLLTRMLASQNPGQFTTVLETVTNYTCNPNISGNVMASIVLCLAELCGNLKAHALGSLRKYMPALIKVLKKQRKAQTPELVLLSTVTAISKIVESLPLFMSPYLQKILYEYALLLSKWQACDQECSKVSAIVSKLINIKKKIASSIPPRVLIPVANETHQLIIEKGDLEAIGPVMSVLSDSFANITTADFTALQHDLTSFFLSALQLRSNGAENNLDVNVIDKAEEEVVNALVSLVLKLSESSFRPFYFRIYDWAIRSNVDGQKDRAITFYRLSSAVADKLKGLFVLFAGHFVKNAADLLDSCNNSKTEQLFFESDEKCISLVNYIIKTLNIVFLYDSQSFLNKDRFETLMQPVVDQLENTVGGIPSLKSRATDIIIPCISQFAVAIADDSLWKLLNYQVLLKTRHNEADVRLIGLECLVAMASQLGSSWLPLLAESVPFLAELLEDGDPRIEGATKNAVRTLEQILGEPLEKYF